jgi:hypothetical protein
MKRKVSVIVLLALSALLCSCNQANAADTETSAIVTEVTVSEPADCCGGEIPDCCKEKEESQADCCKENEESKADCCEEKEESDCCKEESESDCCKHNES